MKLKYLPIYLSLALIAGIYIGRNSQRGNDSIDSSSSIDGASISELFNILSSEYIDTLNIQELEEQAIKSTLAELDPHSYYIPSSELSDINESMNGNFSGIGIEYRIINNKLTVIKSIPGGPAYRAGIKMGDQILSIDGVALNLENDEGESMIKSLRGEAGSIVKLNINNPFNNSNKEIDVSRGEIPISSVSACFKLNSSKLLIKLNRFSGETYSEFLDSLNKYSAGVNELIIDLRNNGGGRLSSAIRIAQLFLSKGDLITYTEGAHQKREEYLAYEDGDYQNLSVKILINEGSASASEVLSGALQYHKKASVIGVNSFGKGLVQQQYDLSNGGAFRLVVAKYYTPEGICIQRPYENMSNDDYYLQNLDSIIYGIQPDIIIKEDTSYNYKLLSKVYNKEMINRIFEYACANQETFKPYTIQSYLNNKLEIARVFLDTHELDDKSLDYLALLIVGDIAKYIHGDSFEEQLNLYGEKIYQEL